MPERQSVFFGRAHRSLSFALVLACVAPVLRSRAADAAPPVDETAKRAREAYNEGQAAFNLGQWGKAVEA